MVLIMDNYFTLDISKLLSGSACEPLHFQNIYKTLGEKNVLEIINRCINLNKARLVKEGKHIEFDGKHEIRRCIKKGATIICHDTDYVSKDLSEICSLVTNSNFINTRTNTYFSQGGGQFGFPIHYDCHDVLILQEHGAKTWNIWDITIENPLFDSTNKSHSVKPPNSNPDLSITLEKGDVLYLPRGYWHAPMPEKDESIHHTVALFPVTYQDIFDFLKFASFEEPILRKSLSTTGIETTFFLDWLHSQLNREKFDSDFWKWKLNNTTRERETIVSLDQVSSTRSPCVLNQYVKTSLPSFIEYEENKCSIQIDKDITVIEDIDGFGFKKLLNSKAFTVDSIKNIVISGSDSDANDLLAHLVRIGLVSCV